MISQNTIDKLNFLSEFVKVNAIASSAANTITFEFSDTAERTAKMDTLNNNRINSIPKATLGFDIVLSNDNMGATVFFEKEHFLRTCNKDTFNNDFVLFEQTGNYAMFDSTTKNLAKESPIFSKLVILNLYYSFQLLDVLKTKLEGYFDELKDEIILHSTEKGIFSLKIIKLKEFIVEKNFKENYEQLQQYISKEKKEFIEILKNRIIESVQNNFTRDNDFLFLILNLGKILKISQQDYNLFISKFSFDGFLTDLRKQKEKYFKDVNEISNKIFTQAIALPIAITATSIATFQINNLYLLITIIIVFGIYTLMYIKIQWSYYNDLRFLADDFSKNMLLIKTKSGFNPEELKSEEKIVRDKFKKNRNNIAYLIIFSMILFFIFSYYILVRLMVINNIPINFNRFIFS